MQQTPLVTVIVPFYNEERFLEETIQSVLPQTYTHWEMMLIDDGSSDGSTAIAKKYAAAYPDKIFYIEHEGHRNRGLSATRNAGIKQAKGEFIALLDADDVWLPQKLERQVSIFAQHPEVAMICEASEYWYSWQNPEFKNVNIPIGAAGNRAYPPQQLSLLLYPLGTGAAPCPSGLIINKAALIAAGGFEESFTGSNQMYEDQPFLAKMYLNETVYVSAACNNMYRQRHGSLVQKVKANGQYKDVRLFFLNWLNMYLQTRGIQNKDVHRKLQKALQPYRHPLYHKAVTFLKRKFARPAHG